MCEVPELPARHIEPPFFVGRKQAALGPLGREILQNRVRLPQHIISIAQRGHAHVGIERRVLRRFLLAFEQIDHVQAGLDAKMVGDHHHFESSRAGWKDIKLGHGPLLCCAIEIEIDHAVSARRLKISSNPGQPRSTSLRIDSPASAPICSNLRCSSSTRVAFVPSGMNLTSTSELTVVSAFQRLLISHVITKRLGGSQTMIFPTLVREPSSASSYKYPPTRVSMTTAFLGALPMPWSSGHQRPRPEVKTSNARAGLALTRMLLRTGAMVTVVVICSCPPARSCQVRLPPGTRRVPHPKIGRASGATRRAPAGR